MARYRSFFHPDCHGRPRSLTGSAAAHGRLDAGSQRPLAVRSARGLYRRWGLVTPPRRSLSREDSGGLRGCQKGALLVAHVEGLLERSSSGGWCERIGGRRCSAGRSRLVVGRLRRAERLGVAETHPRPARVVGATHRNMIDDLRFRLTRGRASATGDIGVAHETARQRAQNARRASRPSPPRKNL